MAALRVRLPAPTGPHAPPGSRRSVGWSPAELTCALPGTQPSVFDENMPDAVAAKGERPWARLPGPPRLPCPGPVQFVSSF